MRRRQRRLYFKRRLRRWRTEPTSIGNETRVHACAPTTRVVRREGEKVDTVLEKYTCIDAHMHPCAM